MAAVERQITVNVPREQVFAYLSDVSRHSEWAGHQLEVKKTSEGPVQVGSSYETVGHQFGAQPAKVTITELVPGQKIVYESDGQVGHFRHQFVLESEDGGVRVTKSFEPLKISSLPLRVLAPLVRSVIAPKGLDGDLKRIKAKMEGGSAAP
jgi:uncharacterized protein YndB with AHSA1/START domain